MSLRIASQLAPAFPLSNRRVFSRTSYCVVLYWHYKKQNFGTMSNIRTASLETAAFQVDKGMLQEQIRSLKVSKTLAQPSGTFDLELAPVDNWKEKLSPGDWMAIYFFDHLSKDRMDIGSPTTNNLVMLGNIDRVYHSIQKDEKDDKTRLTYHVSGRNFGKAFEETDIWYDPYATQVEVADAALRKAGLEIIGSPDSQVEKIVDVFLGPGAAFPTSKTAPLLQWRIPTDVAKLFGVTDFAVPGKPMLYDIVDQAISKLPGYKVRNMLTLESNGSVWEMMSRSCNRLVNELFLEEVRAEDGSVSPTMILRPRPIQTPFFEATGSDTSQFGSEDAQLRPVLMKAYLTMQRHARKNFIEVQPSEIRFENLGKDEHSRFNMFWLQTTLEYERMLSVVASVNKKASIGNPTFIRESIHRHGLKRFDQVIDFCYAASADGRKESQAASRNIDLFKAFMVQIYDMHYANHLYESGTVETTGILEAELGKCLLLKSLTPGKPPKVYYIEGYEHTWKFPQTWSTTFTVTHGQFLVDSGNQIFINASADDNGQPDSMIDTTYLAKTQTRKT